MAMADKVIRLNFEDTDASLSREIVRPIESIAFYAAAALRWLDREEPNVEEAVRGLARIVEHSRSASDIVRSTLLDGAAAPGGVERALRPGL